MGQLTLGLRSLAIKVVVFFALAAALAWILGGTLFPRPEHVDGPTVSFADRTWFVRLSVGGDAPGLARYELMEQEGDRSLEPVGGVFAEASEIVIAGDRLLVGMREPGATGSIGGMWVLREIDPQRRETRHPMGSRLEIEEALEGARRDGATGDGATGEGE